MKAIRFQLLAALLAAIPAASAAPTLLTYEGDVFFGTFTSVNVEIGGTTRGTQYDAMNVAGKLTFAGTLNVTLINGYSPATGASFNLFDWGTMAGTFSTVNLPALGPNRFWDATQLYTTGVLSITGSPFLPTAWMRTVNVGTSQDDAYYRVRRDNDGNVIAVGYTSAGTNGTADILLGKYTANGTLLWQKTYHGRTNGNDYSGEIGLDAQNNIYVVGTSSIGTNHGEVVLLKYEPNGDLAWERFEASGAPNVWNTGGALGVDSSGNTVFTVSGTQGGYGNSQKIRLVSYNAAGNRRWIDGGGHISYTATALGYPNAFVSQIRFAQDGNIYLCGTFAREGPFTPTPGFAAVTSTGSALWRKLFWEYAADSHGDAFDIQLGPDGAVYTCGGVSPAFTSNVHEFVFKLNAATGAANWIKFSDTGPRSQKFALAFDTLGHVSAIGWVEVTNNYRNARVTQWNRSDGAQVWRQEYYRGPNENYFSRIAVDAANKIIIAGLTSSQPTNATLDATKLDATVVRFDSTGAILDTTHFDGAASNRDQFNNLLLDAAGNIFLAGFTTGVGTGPDALLLKYRAAPNTPPVANDFSMQSPGGVQFDVSVLPQATDADGDSLIVSSAVNGVGGTVAVVNGGTAVRFTAEPGFTGNATFTYVVSDGQGGTDAGVVTVTPPYTPSEQWRITHFGSAANTGDAADLSDPDRDGIQNILERALGLNPNVPGSTGAPVPGTTEVNGQKYLTYQFRRPLSPINLAYQIEISNNLTGWLTGSTYGPGGDEPTNANTTEVSRTNDGTLETITVRDNTPISSAPKRVVRLRVTGE